MLSVDLAPGYLEENWRAYIMGLNANFQHAGKNKIIAAIARSSSFRAAESAWSAYGEDGEVMTILLWKIPVLTMLANTL